MRKPKPRREIVARALCRLDGHPEDIKMDGRPMWESYLDQADAVLKALGEETAEGGVGHGNELYSEPLIL